MALLRTAKGLVLILLLITVLTTPKPLSLSYEYPCVNPPCNEVMATTRGVYWVYISAQRQLATLPGLTNATVTISPNIAMLSFYSTVITRNLSHHGISLTAHLFSTTDELYYGFVANTSVGVSEEVLGVVKVTTDELLVKWHKISARAPAALKVGLYRSLSIGDFLRELLRNVSVNYIHQIDGVYVLMAEEAAHTSTSYHFFNVEVDKQRYLDTHFPARKTCGALSQVPRWTKLVYEMSVVPPRIVVSFNVTAPAVLDVINAYSAALCLYPLVLQLVEIAEKAGSSLGLVSLYNRSLVVDLLSLWLEVSRGLVDGALQAYGNYVSLSVTDIRFRDAGLVVNYGWDGNVERLFLAVEGLSAGEKAEIGSAPKELLRSVLTLLAPLNLNPDEAHRLIDEAKVRVFAPQGEAPDYTLWLLAPALALGALSVVLTYIVVKVLRRLRVVGNLN